MAETGYEEILVALRAAARLSKERFLVGVSAADERERVTAALAAEGEVVAVTSASTALERLTEESFELVVLDQEGSPPGRGASQLALPAASEADLRARPSTTSGGQGGVPETRTGTPAQGSPTNNLTAAREIRPFADVVPIIPGDPALAAEMLAQEAAAVLPRPLPASDALFRAHLRYLASCRRARTRALMLDHVIAQNRAALKSIEPALEEALGAVLEASMTAPVVAVLGDSELARIAEGVISQGQADVIVIGLLAADRIEARLREARERAPGAAMVAVDAAPSAGRLSAAIYAGVRAYLGRDFLPRLGRVVAAAATRRRAELTGRQLVETLTRFGFMEEPARSIAPPTQDLDASLIADAASKGETAFVPSAHEVLVVDDEVVVLTVLRELLRRSGYRVTTAASAEEAIDLMHKRTFDLVLTDKNLPGASGLEVLRVARTLSPPPAVVMITAYSSYDSAVTALDIGAQDYIEKPIRDVEALRFRIRRALSRRNEQLARSLESGKEAQHRARIMVVEVEGTRRQLMAEFLGLTYDVVTAANGEQALAQLQQSKFDLVIADRNLPGMSGLRVIEQAQRLLPHCASVLYTAYPSYETVKEAFELGVDAYLVRPNQDLKALGEKVAGALRSHGGILLG
jgi:CheY-like chemotaxis protein